MFEAEIANYFLSNYGLSIMVVSFMFILGLSLTGLLFSIITFYGKNKNRYIFLKEIIVLGTKPTKKGAKKMNSKEEEVCVISKVGKARARIR